jgi:hypothetical protein
LTQTLAGLAPTQAGLALMRANELAYRLRGDQISS